MATAQGMSGIDLRAVTRELQQKLPLWIDKIYQFDSHTLGIRINGENHAKYYLLLEAGRRAHLVQQLPEPPKNPLQFAMLLRKYIMGGKVLSIRQHGLERILIFEIGKGEKTYRLITELYDEGNVILADEENLIIKPLRHHRFRDREVVPGVPYALSATDPTGSEENLAAALKNDDRDLVRALAIACMLGGTYAEYLCRQAGMDKGMPARESDPGKVYAAVAGLFARLGSGTAPVLTAKSCEPIDLTGDGAGTQPFAFYSAALEHFYPMTKRETAKVASRPKLSEEERIRKHQEAAIKKFGEKAEKNQKIADAIYGNYAFAAQVIGTLDAASRTHSFQEIEKELKKSALPDAQRIKAFHPEEAAIDLELEPGIVATIHIHETVEQNAGRYYDTIKKFRKKQDGARAAMKTVRPARKAVRREIVVMKKLWYHRFRWFVTSDGVVVIGGRDAAQNEELVKKYMAGGDTFVHADVHGASVVIVKGKTDRMDEVTQFAAAYSGAWRSGHFSADVYSVRPDQVSKTPQPGEYVSRGSFIVRGERTYFRNVPVGCAIGLMLEPSAAVIGGPASAIRPRAKAVAELKPGQFEPNDTAKKVLRILKTGLSPGEEKALKGVLNTEAVAAFVPPGGSDIAGDHEG